MNFPIYLLLLISNLISLCSEKTLCIVFIFLSLSTFNLQSTYGLSQRISHMHLRRICALLLLGGCFAYVCQIQLVYCIVQPHLYFSLCYRTDIFIFIQKTSEVSFSTPLNYVVTTLTHLAREQVMPISLFPYNLISDKSTI